MLSSRKGNQASIESMTNEILDLREYVEERRFKNVRSIDNGNIKAPPVTKHFIWQVTDFEVYENSEDYSDESSIRCIADLLRKDGSKSPELLEGS